MDLNFREIQTIYEYRLPISNQKIVLLLFVKSDHDQNMRKGNGGKKGE